MVSGGGLRETVAVSRPAESTRRSRIEKQESVAVAAASRAGRRRSRRGAIVSS